ncbi:MAG: YIP1 family protein [Acidobacteriota bacterium]
MHDSAFGRLLGVLVSPGQTFRSIAARPTVWAALLVLVLSTLGGGLLAAPRIDYEDIIRKQVAKSGRDVPQEQLDKQIEVTQKIRTPLIIAQVVFVPIFLCLVTLFPWAIFKLLGSEVDYVRSLSVTAHAWMPQVVSALLSIPVILSRPSLGYEDTRNGFLKSNLGAFMSTPEMSAPLTAVLSSLDVFSLWTLILFILGFKEVAKVSMAKAAGTMIILWLLFVGIKVGFAAVFG